MAIFASTTTSGNSDPLRAMSIKALEQRQKELLALQAQQPGITPENTQTPIQGFAHVANAAVDAMRSRRVDEAAAAQRQQLAQTMAGYDPAKGFTPQQLGVLSTTSPETLGPVLTQFAEDRRQAEKARLDKEAAVDAENRLMARPSSDAAKIAADVKAGRLPAEQGTALIEKLSAPSASETKAGNELQNTHLNTQAVIGDLKEARDLLGPQGTGIRSGTGAGMAQIGAKWIGDKTGLTDDPKLTQRTERYNQIVNAEAINNMAERLKGATTDFELRTFVALMNDPNAEPKTKVDALNKMIAKAEAHAALQVDQLKRAKVSVPTGPATAATGAAAATRSPDDAAALDWATKNASDPRAAAIKQRLGVP